jgi:hypothetical protein
VLLPVGSAMPLKPFHYRRRGEESFESEEDGRTGCVRDMRKSKSFVSSVYLMTLLSCLLVYGIEESAGSLTLCRSARRYVVLSKTLRKLRRTSMFMSRPQNAGRSHEHLRKYV